MQKKKYWGLLVLAPLLAVFGSYHKKTSDNIQKERFLNICFQTEVNSLNPSIGTDYPSTFVVKMLFEGLLRTNLEGKIEPAIARSYEISEDFKTYTFHLRPSFWSNQELVSADDFVYAWKKVVDPHAESLGAQNFYPIKNVQAIVRGEKPLDSMGVKALDPHTLQIELEHPTPYFLEIVATSSFFPVNAKWDQKHPDWVNRDGDAFICNGPYRLQKRRFDHEIVVAKNPSYWDVKNVTMPGICIAIIKEPTTQLHLFEKGQLDWLGKPFSKIPIDSIDHLQNSGKLHFNEVLGLHWYFFNVESFPFSNKKMRQAFAYAIDRKAITTHLLRENETPAQSILPYSLATQNVPFFPDGDQERALKLFNEALEELNITREELPKITVNYPISSSYTCVAEILQQQWNQALGVQVHLEHQEWKTLYDRLQKANFQIGGMGWWSWLRDPIYIMQTFREKSDGLNMSQWENKQYQQLLSATELETDPEKRIQLFNEAETLLMDEMPVIPLYFLTLSFAKNEQLKNVYVSELNEVDFRWSYFE